MQRYFYKLGQQNAIEKFAGFMDSLQPATQGLIRRAGPGAAMGMVPGALAGYSLSDEHPIAGTLGGAAVGGALGAAGGKILGDVYESDLRNAAESFVNTFGGRPGMENLGNIAEQMNAANRSKGVGDLAQAWNKFTERSTPLHAAFKSHLDSRLG